MAVRHSRAVQRLSSAPRQAESRPGTIGPISLDVKQMGERSAGNPHAAFDVAEAGNVARHRPKLARQSSTLPVRGRPVMGVPTAIANRQRLQGFLRHGSDRPSARRCHPTPVVRAYDFYTRASSSARPIRSLVKLQEARRQSHRQSRFRPNRVSNGLPAGARWIRTSSTRARSICLSPPSPCRPRTRAVASGRWRTGGHTSPGRTDPAGADNQHFVGHSFSPHPQSWSGSNDILLCLG